MPRETTVPLGTSPIVWVLRLASAAPWANRALPDRGRPLGPPTHFCGEVAERSNALHSKCSVRETVPWVRIPPSPPHSQPDQRTRSKRARVTTNLPALSDPDAPLVKRQVSGAMLNPQILTLPPGGKRPGRGLRVSPVSPFNRFRRSRRLLQARSCANIRLALVAAGQSYRAESALLKLAGRANYAGSFQFLHSKGSDVAQSDRDVTNDHVPIARRPDE